MADPDSIQRQLDAVLTSRVEALTPHLDNVDIVLPEMTSLLAHIRVGKQIVRRITELEGAIHKASVRPKGGDAAKLRRSRASLIQSLSTLIVKLKTA